MRTFFLLTAAAAILAPAAALGQTGGNCSASQLTGTYAFVLTGRAISSVTIVKQYFEGNGTATFDGIGKVSFALTANSLQASQQQLSYSGTYTMASNCSGTIAINSGDSATFVLVEYNSGGNFAMAGQDTLYTYTGTGTPQPSVCGTATMSGPYSYNATGFSLTTGVVSGAADEAGLLEFDGQGNVTYAYSIVSSGAPTQFTATGTYTMTSACTGAAALTDSSGKTISMNLSVNNAAATAVSLIETSSTFIRTGTAHEVFLNPDQSIGNVASYAVDSTPPGSVFVIFGTNLATKQGVAVTATLPTTLVTTSVLVNGEAAPLFNVDVGQIDVQMPWDIPGGTLATVVVKNGTTVSNAAAVYVPATGTPGISEYGTNRAVVVNQNGTVNSTAAGANVGDEVVTYFTGGGPVTTPGKLVSGAAAPSGLSPLSGTSSITVNGVAAKVAYIGLTPGSIGLYQANFFVPQVAKGSFPLVITIAGQASNNPLITVN